MMRRQNQDQQSRVFEELSALVLNLLRSPTPVSFSDQIPMPTTPVRRRLPEITPAGFASLLLGMSLTLMLCGSVTFFIGFLLMPWVLGLVMVFYVAGIVTTISMLGRSLLCYATAPPSSPRKEIPGNYSRIPRKAVCNLWEDDTYGMCSIDLFLSTFVSHGNFCECNVVQRVELCTGLLRSANVAVSGVATTGTGIYMSITILPYFIFILCPVAVFNSDEEVDVELLNESNQAWHKQELVLCSARVLLFILSGKVKVTRPLGVGDEAGGFLWSIRSEHMDALYEVRSKHGNMEWNLLQNNKYHSPG
ncbi:hypothetical protein POTOM_000458 [Populus tomentosa]|uniref:Uncharacterized protein n=1 Tax=Populus tomentosa TaxID=118781 RepID=A0A8X8AN24_POPTO|nr:hypothetical protein POTOM_000458 [Populus tomentosa]